jgi:hypothetical protein
MKQLTKLFLAVMVLFFITNLNAQKKDYSKEPGYANFGDLSSFTSNDSETEVYLEEHLLKMVAKTTKADEPEISNLINGLKLVKVNQFKVLPKNEPRLMERIEKIENELQSNNWMRIVKAKEKGGSVNVYIKSTPADKICGLVVIYFEKKEVAFINIVGDINLETIGGLSEKFNIPSLKDIKPKKSH